MAILEINLEKPALVEEYQYPEERPAGTESSADRSKSSPESEPADESGSSGSKGKLLGLLTLVAGVGLVVWKLKSGGEQVDLDEFEEETEDAPEPEIDGESSDAGSGDDESSADGSSADGSGGAKRKAAGVLGLVVAVASVAAAVRKRR